jgi:pyruvate/2-oxoglutarate dehydrogenase complex dihydrolipoamide acyltransferase (E2) component
MAHDVVMPMLGMVQDTGTIVSWHKQVGDPVKASDILMEVETDKATVEVEAGFDGFLTAVRAETGVPVPVGQVVAIISDDRGDVGTMNAEAPQVAKAKSAEPAPPIIQAAETVEATPPVLPPVPPPSQASGTPGRVHASPKARRLAKERGIDLGRLVRLGVPEPIHVADLDKAGVAAVGAATASVMRVRITRAPFEAFLEWVEKEAGVAVDRLNLWAAFAAGSLRATTGRGREEEILVEASLFPDTVGMVALRSPDRAGLAGITAEPAGGAAALTILDLTQTVLAEYRPAGDRPLPHLTISIGEDPTNLDLYLEFDPSMLPAETAYAFLKELAERTRVPLRHLL